MQIVFGPVGEVTACHLCRPASGCSYDWFVVERSQVDGAETAAFWKVAGRFVGCIRCPHSVGLICVSLSMMSCVRSDRNRLTAGEDTFRIRSIVYGNVAAGRGRIRNRHHLRCEHDLDRKLNELDFHFEHGLPVYPWQACWVVVLEAEDNHIFVDRLLGFVDFPLRLRRECFHKLLNQVVEAVRVVLVASFKPFQMQMHGKA